MTRSTLASMALVRLMLLLVAGLVGWAAPAAADHMPNTLRVTILDDPDPAASEGEIEYTAAVKNDGRQRSLNVRLETAVPAGTTFVSCRTSANSVAPCQRSGDVVTALFPRVAAHGTVRMFLTVRAPLVSSPTDISLHLEATGDNAHKGDGSQSTTVLPPTVGATLWPSGRDASIGCGDTIDAAFMGADTTVVLTQGLVCNHAGFGLRITASGTTLDLGGKKILHTTPRHAGDVGILVGPDTTGVTIRGGGTESTKGIEHFDICVGDAGGNTGLLVTRLRCFRGRSAGLDLASDDVTVSQSLVDNTIPGSGTTGDPDGGGIGIRARGDGIEIRETIVRRSSRVGIWAHGADTDDSGRVVTITGNTTTSRVETSFAIGILLELGPHLVQNTRVQGTGPADSGTDGVVVGPTAIDAQLDGVQVRRHGGNGIRVEGTGTRIDTGSAEELGGVGYLLLAPAVVSGTTVFDVRGDGYRVEATAAGSLLDSNTVENSPGDGFVVHAAASIQNNSAKEVGGWGYIVTGAGAHLQTNETEVAGAGLLVTGNDNYLESVRVRGTAGIGIEVRGTGNSLDTCEAEQNVGAEFVIGPGNLDEGGNSVNGSSFSFSEAGGTFE